MKKHKHHIIPRHAGGSDDPSNLVELTVEEHAQAHLDRYNELGDKYDLLAYNLLSGQIDPDEGRKKAVIEGNRRGGKNSKNTLSYEEQCDRMAKARKVSHEKKLGILDPKYQSREFKSKAGKGNLGVPKTKCCCYICGREISVARLWIHQGSAKCKQKTD